MKMKLLIQWHMSMNTCQQLNKKPNKQSLTSNNQLIFLWEIESLKIGVPRAYLVVLVHNWV